MPCIGVREGCFCILSSEEVDRVHGTVFVDYLREVTLESWLRSVWSGDLDSLSKCL